MEVNGSQATVPEGGETRAQDAKVRVKWRWILNFFSCSYRLSGNVFEAFWLFPYLCCCCCCFVCLLKYEKRGTCSSVCLPVWFVWLLVHPFAVPLRSQYNVLALRISTEKKNCFNFDWTIYNEWIISSRNPWGGSPCLRMSLSASASLSRSVVVLRPLSIQSVDTML